MKAIKEIQKHNNIIKIQQELRQISKKTKLKYYGSYCDCGVVKIQTHPLDYKELEFCAGCNPKPYDFTFLKYLAYLPFTILILIGIWEVIK